MYINGKEQRCFNDWYVIHDGENVIDVVSEFLLNERKKDKEHLEKTGFETPREYAAYLKGYDKGWFDCEDEMDRKEK